MTPEQVLSLKPKVLSQKQRERYFRDGYLLLEKFLPDSWVERLKAATEAMVEKSRGVTKSDAVWDLDKGHTREAPRLTRTIPPARPAPTSTIATPSRARSACSSAVTKARSSTSTTRTGSGSAA